MVHDMELMRMQGGRPAVLLEYFSNESVNSSDMITVLDAIAAKVRPTFNIPTSPDI